MKLNDLITYLDKFLNCGQFNDSGLNGLQVEGRGEVNRIAFAVSATSHAIEKACLAKADALIVHHGLFWKKEPYPIIGNYRKRVAPLLENNLSLLAYHLPLDAHEEVGNNWLAAKDLEWKELLAFGRSNNSHIGVQGKVEGIPVDAFIERMEGYFKQKATLAKFGGEKIEKVAFVSGGAWRWIEEAIEKGVDAFITGSFDEPAWSLAKEGNIHFIAVGHFASERRGIFALGEHIRQKFNIEVLSIDDENPF